jgi:hypothetical protein
MEPNPFKNIGEYLKILKSRSNLTRNYMKKIRNQLFVLVIIGITFSCSVEKRVHMPGYAVNIKNQAKSSENEVKESAYHLYKIIFEPNNSHAINTDKSIVENTNVLLTSNNSLYLPIDLTKENNVHSISSLIKNEKNEIAFQTVRQLRKELKTNELQVGTINSSSDKVVHWGAIVGLSTGVVGLFIFGILFGICAIVFSSIALGSINKNPEKYKGKGMAIAGLVIGIVGISLYLILLAIIL